MAKKAIRLALVGLMLPMLAGCSSVVARVNGQNITKAEFYEELQRSAGLDVLRATILRRLMLERAAAEKCLPTAEEVRAKVALFKKQRFNDDEQEMRKWMKGSAIDDIALQDQIKYELATFKLKTRKLKPTDEDLQRFFKEYHEELFDKPERVTFRQIAVPSKEAAQAIIAKLNADNAIFNEVAREASIDPGSKDRGGLYEDIDWRLIKAKAPEVFAALKKLEPNQITQSPVAKKTDQGTAFLVLKLVESKPAEVADFAKIKEDVKQAFLEKNAESDQELLAEVTKGANVVVLADRFKGAIEPAFQAQKPGGVPNVPPEVEKQLEKKPDIAPPTQLDEKSIPKTTVPGGGN